ncbi:MAG: asparagine synthase (glutamine-hydrolyzing), partial [Kiritimatiellae bacterium]|nr:asparagine synthase (glutamine-hydrolyzing) [Kiritimatiellia bacterium]MDW8459546.1 asparagine synthase (glutamine-hydrolyzing) [Verrucomicrobiota bacterium]
MNERLAHRGPDGAGIAVFSNCVLGHRRLSIIDPEGGQQPMYDASGQRCVVFNGEIYGFREIIPRLNYPFRTTCDTEVLLALYDKYGSGMMAHLPGMFAFAIWDEREQRLFAARDRMGEKPLYYARLPDGGLVMSSEVKGILASGLVRSSIDLESLSHYLMFGYSPRGRSIYRDIDSLPPAHTLEWKNGSIRIARYWTPPPPSERVDEREAIAEFKARLDRAVQKQLVADVEVAAFLSGGLDSSSVVRLASRYNPALRTISYGFEEPFSELRYAREVARHCGTCHIEEHDANQDIPSLVQRMAEVYDEPFFDSSAVPTWLICRKAARYVKVVLTGDGGDEIVGGYNFWYKPIIAMHEHYPRQTRWKDLLYFSARIAQRLGVTTPAIDQFTRLYGLRRRCKTVPRAHWYQQRVFSPSDLARWGLPAVPLEEADRFPDNPS